MWKAQVFPIHLLCQFVACICIFVYISHKLFNFRHDSFCFNITVKNPMSLMSIASQFSSSSRELGLHWFFEGIYLL